jgi:hypothetical protein
MSNLKFRDLARFFSSLIIVIFSSASHSLEINLICLMEGRSIQKSGSQEIIEILPNKEIPVIIKKIESTYILVTGPQFYQYSVSSANLDEYDETRMALDYSNDKSYHISNTITSKENKKFRRTNVQINRVNGLISINDFYKSAAIEVLTNLTGTCQKESSQIKF